MSQVVSRRSTKSAAAVGPRRHAIAQAGPAVTARAERSTVRRGFSWLAVGNTVNAICSWARIALLARWGNAEMIGQVTLALAICTPIGSLADLGLAGSLISDVRHEFRFRHYLGLRLLTCLTSMAVILAAALLGPHDAATARLVIVAGLVVAGESVCDLFQAAVQRQERMFWVALSLIVRGLLGLALFAIGLRFVGSLAWGVMGFFVAALVTLVAIDIPQAMRSDGLHPRSHSPAPLPAILWQLAWLSLPLGLATASLSLTTSIPRYWIGRTFGNEALGGFAVAGSLMVALSLVVGAMSQAAAPRLARYHLAGDRLALVRLLRSLAVWVGGVSLVAVATMTVGGRPILQLLYGPGFGRYAGLAACLMLAAGLRNFSILLGRAISSMRHFRMNLMLRIFGIMVLVALLPGWVAWLGLMGAACAVTLAWLVTVLVSAAYVVKAINDTPTWKGNHESHE